jgi:hypothetical protein
VLPPGVTRAVKGLLDKLLNRWSFEDSDRAWSEDSLPEWNLLPICKGFMWTRKQTDSVNVSEDQDL